MTKYLISLVINIMIISNLYALVPNREKYIKVLPNLEPSNDWKSIFNSPNTFYYTDNEIPPAYQDWGELFGEPNLANAVNGVWSTHYNIAGINDPFGNANKEFPWAKPFGTDLTNSYSFRFIHLPTNPLTASPYPIVWWPDNGYKWIFPANTIVGEVLYFNVNNNSTYNSYVYEIRIRKRKLNKWSMDVFRPFPTKDHFKDFLIKYYINLPREQFNSQLGKINKQINLSTDKLVWYNIKDNNPNRVILAQSKQYSLFPIPEKYAKIALKQTTFLSTFGQEWDKHCNAPTFHGDSMHIVPKNYTGGFIQVNFDSCMKCHDTCNKPARQFDLKRDWYGRVRGSDGIFSFHPFDKSSISSGVSLKIKMNQDLINKSIIAQFDRNIHLSNVYQRVKGLD